MSGRYWMLCAAAGGRLVVLTTVIWLALGQQGASKDEPIGQRTERQSDPQTQEAADSIFWSWHDGSPGTYRAICEQPSDASQADLCQQWRAAETAEQAAKWAFWQLIASAAGVAGLIITIIFTAKATASATHAANASRDTVNLMREMDKRQSVDTQKNLEIISSQAESLRSQSDIASRQMEIYTATQRAFISFVNMTTNIHLQSHQLSTLATLGLFHPPNVVGVIVHNNWQNSGVTPALDVAAWSIGPYFIPHGDPDDFEMAPPDESEAQNAPIGPRHAFEGPELAVEKDLVDRVTRKEGNVIIGCGVKYRDIFGDQHNVEIWFRMDIYGLDPMNPDDRWNSPIHRPVRFVPYKKYSRYT